MRAIEFLTEYRDRMYQYIKSIVPGFPDYVVKDWLYANFARGATQGPNWSFDTIGKDIPNILKDMGLSVDTKWQLVPNMKFTMDMWEPKTLKRLQARAGGSSKSTEPDVHIPARDAERHTTQAQLAQQQGGVRKEPVILIKMPNGYELLEGWHRTIQHFAKYPNGYTGPAYVAVAQSQQGLAEGSLKESAYEEAWELISQPVPEIQQFVKQLGLAQDDNTAKQIAPMIDATPDTQLPVASIPKLKNLANKGNDVQTLKAIQQISGRPDAAQQYAKIMQARDAGEGRQRGYDVNGLINSVKSGNYEAPVLLKLATGTYVIGGRTRLYAALALGIPVKVKIISVSTFAKQGQQGLAEGKLSVDVPNEDWLQEKIDYAKSKGRNSYGVPYMGSTTAGVVGTPPRVRVMRLASLPGMRNEQMNVRKSDLKWLMDYMEKTGKLPPMGNSPDREYLPYIMVAYNGEAWVNEGNHRIMAAYRLNWQDMPIEIRYFDGGERIKDGPMYPGKIGLGEVDVPRSESIEEVFEPGKQNWKWRRQSSDEAFASFLVGDREYQWHAFSSEANSTKWEIQFRLMRASTDPDGLDLFGQTGTGNSAEVLSTAVDITRSFLQNYGLDKVEEITFNAKEDSRINLYAKMIRRLLPNWHLSSRKSLSHGMQFTLTDPRAYDKPEKIGL